MVSIYLIKITILVLVSAVLQMRVNGGICFPASALVSLESGAKKKMSELSIGDRVAVGGGKYSEVILFSHRIVDGSYEFVELQAGSSVLRLTADHYIYASHRYIPAGDVKLGDKLELGDGSYTAVTAVKMVMDVGLYNPQTVHGDILVNGLRAGTFTPEMQHKLANPSLSPLHAMFKRLGLTCTVLESNPALGSSSMPSERIMA